MLKNPTNEQRTERLASACPISGPRGKMPQGDGKLQARVDGLLLLILGPTLVSSSSNISGGGHPHEVLEGWLVFIT